MVNNKLINLITNKTDGGKRIDQFISQNSELSRQRISTLITNGYIFLNGEVVVLKKIKLTGNKETQKKYYRHTGFPGGLKTRSVADLRQDKPEQIIIKAVKGMLPKNKLSNSMISKLKVYKGSEHPHVGQNPELLEA